MPARSSATRKPDTGTATLTVCCNFPPGLILHLCYEGDDLESGYNGPRTVKRWYRDLDHEVRINGPALATMYIDPKFRPDNPPIVSGGYALTPGVSKDFWERWLEQNKDTPLVQNKLIFANTSVEDASAKAKDFQKNRTGMEPVDQDSPRKRSDGSPISELGRIKIEKGSRAPQ
jgi:hypothetical protein